jgi:hypothetical protein
MGACEHERTVHFRDENENRIRQQERCTTCGSYWNACFAKRERPEFRSVVSSNGGEERLPREDDGQLWWGPIGEWTYSGPHPIPRDAP